VEKRLYTLWQRPAQAADDFRDMLLEVLSPRLAALDTLRGIRLAVADSGVARAAKRRIESHPSLPGALLSIWADSCAVATTWERLIDDCVERRSGYLVDEVEPLVSEQVHPCGPGERVYGMCQLAFLRKPSKLARDDWLAIWQGDHTQVAIETQSTFGYRQNVVLRALDEQTLSFDAIVEESFPPRAMASDHAFYDTGGDEKLLHQRMTTMLESCARFIDFEHIDVIPMSEYRIK